MTLIILTKCVRGNFITVANVKLITCLAQFLSMLTETGQASLSKHVKHTRRRRHLLRSPLSNHKAA